MAAATKDRTNHREPTEPSELATIGDVNAPITAGWQVPRLERWVDLDAPFEGARIFMWINFPREKFFDIQNTKEDPEKSLKAFREIVIKHDNWMGTNGKPLPPTDDPAFLTAIDQMLLNAVMGKVEEAYLGKLDFPMGTSSAP